MSISRNRTDGRVTIGKIVGAHGVNGAMKIYPLTDFPERFLSMRSLTLERGGRPTVELPVDSIALYEGKGLFIFSTKSITNRDQAESMRGALVTIDQAERVELDEDEFWIDDLIGVAVFDAESGENLGELTDVLQTGGNDVYEVRRPDGSSGMIPAVASVVREVDVKGRRITVSLPEGLWD